MKHESSRKYLKKKKHPQRCYFYFFLSNLIFQDKGGMYCIKFFVLFVLLLLTVHSTNKNSVNFNTRVI